MKYHVEFEIDFKRNPYSGKFIAIEGIDGSGKTTQAKKVVEELKKHGRKVVYTKEPTDGLIGEFIRKGLLGLSSKIRISPVAFQYLFVADRVEHQKEVEDYLKKGYIVISDRSLWSSVPYGMVDRGVDFSDQKANGDSLLTAFSILSFYNQFIAPDKTLFLDIPVDTAMKRIGQKKEEKEIYEKRDMLEKIRVGYQWLITKFKEEFTVIKGEESVEEITEEILHKLPK